MEPSGLLGLRAARRDVCFVARVAGSALSADWCANENRAALFSPVDEPPNLALCVDLPCVRYRTDWRPS